MDYKLLRSDGSHRETSLFELKDLYERGQTDLRDVVLRDGQHWLVGEVLGHSLGNARFGLRGVPVPAPPSISWSTVAVIGGFTGGYGLAFIALLQGLWSYRISRRLGPILLPCFSLLAVPLHLISVIYILARLQSPLWTTLGHMIVGLVVTDVLAFVAVILGSLSLRTSLLARLGREGFQMNWFLTVAFGPVYVSYKAHELRDTSY